MKKKYITLKIDADDWKTARWVINCFQSAVHNAYTGDAPRVIEADATTKNLHKQARKQVEALYGVGEYDT
jgi:hypothetical protein